MKILLVHNIYPIVGGDGVFFHETGRFLKENGHEIAYFCSSHEGEDDTPWAKYFGKHTDPETSGFLEKVTSVPSVVYSKHNRRKFAKLLADFKPDLVHCFTIHTKITPSILDECSKQKVPVIISCNDYKHICPNYKLFHHGKICTACKNQNFLNAIKYNCCKESLAISTLSAIEATVNHNILNIYKKNIHTFLFSSTFMVEMTEEFWGKDTFKYDYLKNPFNSLDFKLEKEFDDYFLFFGRIIDEKGVDRLLEAMSLVPEHMKLVVVGDGPMLQECKEISEKHNLKNVEFVGAKWKEDLNQILRRCRYVIVPSIWYENYPYVIHQAFAMGKPVIGSNRGGIPEMIKHGENGYVFDIDNKQELAERIVELWENTTKTLEMGEAAKVYADANYNGKKFYETLIKIYQRVLS